MSVCVWGDSEPDSLELQEAISKDSFQHDVTNLEAATTYSLYLKAYSPLGASRQSNTVVTTTLGGGRTIFLLTPSLAYVVNLPLHHCESPCS